MSLNVRMLLDAGAIVADDFADYKHREVFFAVYGLGPWTCWGCSELVFRRDLHVHHIDRDNTNHHPENIVPMHVGCHQRLPRPRNRPPTVRELAAWAAMRGKPGRVTTLGMRLPGVAESNRRRRGEKRTSETRQRISDALKGRPLHENTRRAVAESNRRRKKAL